MGNKIPNGQSSPGILQSGQLASNGILHMPQLSSLAIQRQVATPVQPEERTNLVVADLHEGYFMTEKMYRESQHNRVHEIKNFTDT